MDGEFMLCPTCRDVTMVEIPPCADEHGADCPDRACTICGAALSHSGAMAWSVPARPMRMISAA